MEHRRAMLRNMVTSLILEERIETTLPKAKELRRVADRMITLGKRGTLHARRQALSYVRTNEAVQKLFSELATRFNERHGGYTRILKLGQVRRGDAAPIAIIEYLGAPMKPSREERKRLKAEARRADEAEAKKSKPKKKSKSKTKPETKKAKAEEKAPKAETKKAASAKPAKAKTKPESPIESPKKKFAKEGGKKGVLGRVFKRKSQKTVKK